MKIQRIAHFIGVIARPIDRLSTFIVAVLMGIIAVLVFAQVVARYGFSSSFDAVQEIPRVSFILVVFLAMPLAYAKGMHVGMDLLSWIVPKTWYPAIARVVSIVMAVAMVLVIYFAILMSMRTWYQYLPSVDFPIGGFYAGVAYGAAHLLIHIARSFVEGHIEQTTTMAD